MLSGSQHSRGACSAIRKGSSFCFRELSPTSNFSRFSLPTFSFFDLVVHWSRILSEALSLNPLGSLDASGKVRYCSDVAEGLSVT